MKLKDRVTEARRIAPFVWTENGRAFIVPGHEGRRYQVILKRRPGVIQVRCEQWTALGPTRRCPGNSAGVCYHGIAAIIAAAERRGYGVSFAENARDAARVRRLHPDGSVFSVVSVQSGRTIYGVYYPNGGER